MDKKVIDKLIQFGLITNIGVDADKYNDIDDLITKGIITVPGAKTKILELIGTELNVEIESTNETVEPITEVLVTNEPVIDETPESAPIIDEVPESEPVIDETPEVEDVVIDNPVDNDVEIINETIEEEVETLVEDAPKKTKKSKKN